MMTQAFYFPFQSFLLNEIVIRSVHNSPSHDKCQTPGYSLVPRESNDTQWPENGLNIGYRASGLFWSQSDKES